MPNIADGLFIMLLLPVCLLGLFLLIACLGVTRHLLRKAMALLLERVSSDLRGPRLITADQRLHARHKVSGTAANVTDGCIFCTALIENISAVGICLKRLPKTLYQQADRLTVFINDQEGRQVLHVQPRWQQDSHCGKTVGARIVDPPMGWEHFVDDVGRLQPVPLVVREELRFRE